MESIKKEFESLINNVEDYEQLKQLKAKFLGRNGSVTNLFKKMSALNNQEKKEYGKKINELKNYIEDVIDEKYLGIKEKIRNKALESESVDITLPGRRKQFGAIHPITKTIMEIENIFSSLGFDVEYGPEIEQDMYNFEMLNIPKEHPARDMQDTFYIDDNTLLRTHTSPTQVRVMKHKKPPVMFISPGKVYRRDSDITHSTMFHQIEGLLIDKNIHFSDLKGVLSEFLQIFFGDVAVRFRPSYFPFTEPSAEVDIECIMCKGKGCRVCSHTGFLEVLGCGMVHPNVIKNVGYEDKWNGFAFGLGVERFAMLKYGIDNIRMFFENDMRFLDEFSYDAGRVL